MAFPIYARFACPDNGYQDDRDLAAKHLTPGKTYLIDHMDVGRSHTTLYLHDFRGIGFNSVMFAAGAEPDEEDWCSVAGDCVNGPVDHIWHVSCQTRAEAAGTA